MLRDQMEPAVLGLAARRSEQDESVARMDLGGDPVDQPVEVVTSGIPIQRQRDAHLLVVAVSRGCFRGRSSATRTACGISGSMRVFTSAAASTPLAHLGLEAHAKLTLEISGGGAVHDGPTGRDDYDSFDCSRALRASASLGYAIDNRWTLYGTFAHISNAGLWDHIKTCLNSAGLRLGYKLN